MNYNKFNRNDTNPINDHRLGRANCKTINHIGLKNNFEHFRKQLQLCLSKFHVLYIERDYCSIFAQNFAGFLYSRNSYYVLKKTIRL